MSDRVRGLVDEAMDLSSIINTKAAKNNPSRHSKR
jgi:hypothetical protein